VHLSLLRLRGFRNLVDQELHFPPGGVAIVGDNGQGKTNLLESIYYLEIFRSFRGAPDEQLVRFGEEVFRVVGRGEGPGGQGVEVAAAFERRTRRKKVTRDAVEPPRLGEALGALGAVVFSPSDVAIVSGSPSGRRRFLDIVLSLSAPRYLETLQRYRHILAQRNALLRAGADRQQIAAWDPGLVEAGSRVTNARAEWLSRVSGTFASRFAEISGGSAGALEYEPSVPQAGPPEEVAGSFREALERSAGRDARRGMTLVGPHRDDLRMRAEVEGGWVDLRTYGSGGQQRTGAVALRMVEAETIRQARDRDPILLLDDVFAELDPGRSSRILAWIEREERGQVILTAPKETDVAPHGAALPRWRLAAGRVEL
jgi:DNA replication and repair protein RecF